MGICRVNKLVVGNKNTEKGSIQIYGKDIDVLKLGDTTHEGGDIKIYRDGSGNLQFSVDADAASNAKAVDIYGGVVCQHYLTVGQAALDTSNPFYLVGNGYITASLLMGGACYADSGFISKSLNLAALPVNIRVSGTDATDHSVSLQIDGNNIVEVKATGAGAGGVIDQATKAYGLFGVTPQVQQAHIADVAAAAGDPPTKAEFDAFATKFNTLLADLEGYGHLKTS